MNRLSDPARQFKTHQPVLTLHNTGCIISYMADGHTKPLMMKAEQLGIEHAQAGHYKMSQTELYRSAKIGGDYYYRVYVRAYNKAIKAIQVGQINTSLVDILKAETESLRVQYLARTAEWSAHEFGRIEKAANRPYPNYADFATPNFTGHIDYAQGKAYHKAVDARHAACKIVEAGLEAFTARNLKLAEQHYQDSIIKLAARIEKKGLDQNLLTVKTAHVGVNIETVLTDGAKTVKAFTIIASGPVQKPHYRYLIK
jgi:hypothetical protein